MKYSAVISDGTFPCNTAVLQGDLKEVIKEAAEIGYDAVQLTVNDPSEVDRKLILDEIDKYGLRVSALATGRIYSVDGLSLGSKDEANRTSCVERMKGHIDLARELDGSMVIIGGVRGWSRDADSLEEYHKQFDKSIAEIVEYAEKEKIVVILEALNGEESDIYISIRDTAAYIRKVNSPSFKLQLDTMHMLNENEEIYQQILDNGDILAQLDISGQDRSCPDGDKYDYPLVIKALKEINFQGYLAFEYKAEPPSNAAKKGLDYIRKLL